jgi:hypothetical protein
MRDIVVYSTLLPIIGGNRSISPTSSSSGRTMRMCDPQIMPKLCGVLAKLFWKPPSGSGFGCHATLARPSSFSVQVFSNGHHIRIA